MYIQRGSVSKKVILLGVLVVIAAAAGAYLHFHKNNPDNLVNSKSNQKITGTTSQPTQHQSSSSGSSSSISGQSGGVQDNSGQSGQSLPPSSKWVSSNSGNITLQLPSPNSTLKNGDSLTGLAKVSDVQFILTDNSIGMIAQGNLNVVNGKFSGTLQFTPHSSSGKLEVYYPNPSNGAEQDIVEINVNFSST